MAAVSEAQKASRQHCTRPARAHLHKDRGWHTSYGDL